MRVGVRWIWGAYATPGIFILFIGWIVYYSYRHSLAQVRKMKTPVIHYRVTDEFLYVQSDLASGQNSWAIFKGLQKHAKLWRIITQQGASMILPVENLDDALKSFLSAKLSSVDKPFGSRFFVILGFWFLVFIVIMYFFKSKHH
jgi:hypothetical protein